jgi:hypothetical protein
MKKINFTNWLIVGLLILLPIFIGSCDSIKKQKSNSSKEKEKTVTEERTSQIDNDAQTQIQRDMKIIPSDALFVYELNTKRFVSKANLLQLKGELENIFKSIGVTQDEWKSVVESIETPANVGVDLLKPMYVFIPSLDPTRDYEPSVFCVSEVTDKSKLVEHILSNSELTIQNLNDISWIYLKNTVVGAITSNALLVSITNDPIETFHKILQQNDNYFATKAGKFMAKYTGDVTCILNLEALPRKIREEAQQELRELDDLPEIKETLSSLFNSQIVANINFEPGKISLNLHTNGLNTNILDQIFSTVQSRDLEQIPNQNILAALAVGVNGNGIWDFYQNRIASNQNIPTDVHQALDQFKELFRSTNGTALASVGLTDFSNEVEPEMLFVLPISHSKVENMFDEQLRDLPKNFNKSGDNSHFAISNLPNYQYGRVSKPFKNASNAASCYAYAYINLKAAIDEYINEEVGQLNSEEQRIFAEFQKLLELIDNVDLKLKKDEISLALNLTDSSKNSLNLILSRCLTLVKVFLENENAGEETIDHMVHALRKAVPSAESNSYSNAYFDPYEADYHYDHFD